MRVLYWGTYDSEYVRNRVVIEGLRQNGATVRECRAALWRNTADKVANARGGRLRPRLLLRMIWAYAQLLARSLFARDYDVMVVGYAGHLDIYPARVLAWVRRKPLVLDAYLSLHETIVEDRQLVRANSLAAKLIFAVEHCACRLPDLVLLDTQADVDYFVAKYGLDSSRLLRVFVGAERAYQPAPAPPPSERLRVLYLGKFIPLHGLEHILRAAALLRDAPVTIQLIGDGQTYEAMRELAESLQLSNVVWGARWLEPEALAGEIAQSDVCLGVFAASPKTARVIPTKVFTALAMGKALVTADTPGARELLTDGKDALLCPVANPEALAAALRRLAEDRPLVAALGANGLQLSRQRLTTQAVTQELYQRLLDLVSRRKRG
ncbi:MAG: glycosyltransferase family 4 protein [Chloroflexi bacterium]|nr:glycosyltransferase family 4 protein [Chloroflexota bacterium]